MNKTYTCMYTYAINFRGAVLAYSFRFVIIRSPPPNIVPNLSTATVHPVTLHCPAQRGKRHARRSIYYSGGRTVRVPPTADVDLITIP